jgi:hypothetical protein
LSLLLSSPFCAHKGNNAYQGATPGREDVDHSDVGVSSIGRPIITVTFHSRETGGIGQDMLQLSCLALPNLSLRQNSHQAKKTLHTRFDLHLCQLRRGLTAASIKCDSYTGTDVTYQGPICGT